MKWRSCLHFFGRFQMAEDSAGHSGGSGARPLRRDAERNRQRILAAAAEVFNERGLDVSLDEIARHAGVGVGTVYRRFRTKEELIEALFMDRLASVAAGGAAVFLPGTGGRRSWGAPSGCGSCGCTPPPAGAWSRSRGSETSPWSD